MSTHGTIIIDSYALLIKRFSVTLHRHIPYLNFLLNNPITYNTQRIRVGSPFVVNLSDIEEREKEDEYEATEMCGTNVYVPPVGEVDSQLSHQLQDANKIITKELMHDNTSSSYFYSDTRTSSMLQNTKMSRNEYENVFYQKGNNSLN